MTRHRSSPTRIALWLGPCVMGAQAFPLEAQAAAAEGIRRGTADHWAFTAPKRAPLPTVANAAWPRNAIDYFILARLEREGVAPSLPADRVTLIRRLSLDLIGLPPAPADVNAFVADARPDAYPRLVKQLLASPHFGERWGRHWLDVARYADSDGYEKDSPRPYAWRYRDWVINVLNRDMPFDRFVIEQLAGDLLPGATIDQRIATGFHRNTLRNREGGADPEEDRVKNVVDRVNTTGLVFLGLTVGCAQCHDHKYDPMSQREYYGLYAFFNNADEVDLAAPLPGEREHYERVKARHDEQLAALLNESSTATDERTAALTRAVEAHRKTAPKPPDSKAQTLVRREALRASHVHIRGDFLRPGEPVKPHTPAVLPPLHSAKGPRSRLDLAHWLVRPTHPLTARVAVNRIWQVLFGQGLVATSEDFGSRGEEPSHPALLDWLALELPARGWSTKAIIELIVNSTTYRQRSHDRPELRERDPKNVLLARQNRIRIEAEIIRDSFLTVSGLLDPTVGGPSMRPPLPAGVAALGYANSVKWKESGAPEKYRRGLYIFFQRTVPYPMLMAFDCPDSNVANVRRARSNTPLQALTLLNDPVFVECAQSLARRVLTHGAATDDAQRLRYAFRLCLSRPPTDGEVDELGSLLRDQRAFFEAEPDRAARLVGGSPFASTGATEAAAWIALSRILLNLDEFVTRE